MKRTQSVAVVIALLPSLCWASQLSTPQVLMPPGIGMRLTLHGPVFIDAKGMTLYKTYGTFAARAQEPCTEQRYAVIQDFADGKVDFEVAAPDLRWRRSCIQKRPPLVASPDARPIGEWSIHSREDGSKQWAYAGEPLHTSIKDKVPGDVNGVSGPWTAASAPVRGLPAGLTLRQTVLGLTLADQAGKTLYYQDRDAPDPDAHLWRPVAAPALASTDSLPDWSIFSRLDAPHWALKGRAVYTYSRDSLIDARQPVGDVFGQIDGAPLKGWHVVLLKETPKPPPGVTISTVVRDGRDENPTLDRVYANSDGKTLYTIRCLENTTDQLDCDDVGDSPRYWMSFCGSSQQCATTWRPMTAPTGGQPIGDVWSVIVINPGNPWQPLEKEKSGESVWAYRGRPVFTYARDFRRGDYNGSGTAIGGMAASPIPAY
jgi:predicted lipoprotein with Yx(FWY)xxD motif